MRKINNRLMAIVSLWIVSLANVALANPATVNHPGRDLASNCFQCHGTDGYGYEHLAGKRVSKIVEELQEMSDRPIDKNIMNVHAQAYTADEIKLIANYFSKQ